MPTYSYQCQEKKCQHVQNRIHKISEDPVYKCTECGAPTKRIITAAPRRIWRWGHE